MTIYVALVGPKGCGKTTIARELVRQYGEPKAAVLSFADPLRKMVEVGLGIPQSVMTDAVQKEIIIPKYNASPRKILQTLGTEWGRELIDNNIWVNAWRTKAMDMTLKGVELIVVDDLRFHNEADVIKAIGGVVIRVERSSVKYGSDNHASECSSDIYSDIVIENNSDESSFSHDVSIVLKFCLDREKRRSGEGG